LKNKKHCNLESFCKKKFFFNFLWKEILFKKINSAFIFWKMLSVKKYIFQIMKVF